MEEVSRCTSKRVVATPVRFKLNVANAVIHVKKCIETQEVEVENLTPAVEETVAKQVENVQKINKFNRLQLQEVPVETAPGGRNNERRT